MSAASRARSRLAMSRPLDQFSHVATYRYTDHNGRTLFEKRRYEFLDPIGDVREKTFRYWDPATQRMRKPSGADRCLYRIPSLRVALRRGRPIHLPEGEKDADALREAGVVATSHHQGAGHSTLDQARLLRRASRVVLWMDRDSPNPEVGAYDVALRYNNLISAGLRPDQLTIVGARTGKDPFDHLQHHNMDDSIEIDREWLSSTAWRFTKRSAREKGYRRV